MANEITIRSAVCPGAKQMPDSKEITVIDAKAQFAAQEDRILAAVRTRYVVGVNKRVTQA